MPEILTCQFCHSETPAEHNFCTICNEQIRCLHAGCDKLLVAGKTFCFGCGKPTHAAASETEKNRFVHDVKQHGKNYDEHTEFTFSDDVARELTPFVGGRFFDQSAKRPPFPLAQKEVFLPPTFKALTNANLDQNDVKDQSATEQTEVSPEPSPANDVLDGAGRFFRRDGDILLAETKDYKGSNWAEQQRRFILLYASAYEQLLGKPVVNNDHFKTVADKANIIDRNNFTRYLNEVVKKFFLTTSIGLALNNDGKQEVSRVIGEIDNHQTPEGEAYWNQSQVETIKRFRLSEKDKERLQAWAKEDINLGQLDPLSIKSGRDYALLSFWLLITHLKKGECFRWNEAYEYLKAKFRAVSASPEKFSEAVRNESNKGYFRESGNAFFLSPEANTKVEGWVAGTSKPGSPDTKPG